MWNKILCCGLAVYLFVGCANSFVVIDQTGMTFNLNDVKLKRGNHIEILDGEAVRVVALNQIIKLVLDPSKTYYHNNKLYYHAIVELVDGTVIKPRKNGNFTTKSFVGVDNLIIGKGTSGKVRIPMEDVNVMSQTFKK